MKSLKLIAAGLILGFGLAAFTHTALARKGVKLIADIDNDIGPQLSAAISGNSVIVGSPSQNTATVFEYDGKNWENQGPTHPSPRRQCRVVRRHQRRQPDHRCSFVPMPAPMPPAQPLFLLGGQETGFSEQNWAQTTRPKQTISDILSRLTGTPSSSVSQRTMRRGRDTGSAYIFVREGVGWKKQAKLVASDLAGGDSFGESVFIHGNTAVVGANGHTHGGARFGGAAYVFVRTGNQWAEQAKLVVAETAKADRFGSSVSMSGKTIVVGAPFRDSERATDSGRRLRLCARRGIVEIPSQTHAWQITEKP